MLKSQSPIHPGEILQKFSEMAKKSKALDGDWQGDGWGVGWLSENQSWHLKKSIRPIWKEKDLLDQIPKTKLILIHARSSSFPQHKKILAYNQPFIRGPFLFVFNGFLRGVNLPYPVEGRIGSQKVWKILSDLLFRFSPQEAISELKDVLSRNSRSIQALNIGLCNKEEIHAYCQYSTHPEYYNLQFYDSPSLKMISSELLEGYHFQPVTPYKLISF